MCVAFLLCLLAAAGCSAPQKEKTQRDTLTLTDDLGREVAFPARPQRVVSLSPSFLEPMHAAGVKLIARPTSKHGVPDFAKELAEVGATTNVNIEQIVALQPDLVVGYAGLHDKFVQVLESNQIPTLIFKMKTYEEVVDKLRLFGRISGDTAAAEEAATAMEKELKAVQAQLPAKKKRVAILHSTSKSVQTLLDGSIAGSTAKLLGLVNIASGETAVNKTQDAAPFSLEKLVEEDPDIVFIVTMGDLEEIRRRMDGDMADNPAWHALRAVREKRIYYLSQELFLLNPGLKYPQAAKTMAKLAYPEVFGDA